MKEFKTDDDLAFAINRAIGDLQNIVKDLPYGATNAELKETIKQTDTVLYTLISAVDGIDRQIRDEEKPKSSPVKMWASGMKEYLVVYECGYNKIKYIVLAKNAKDAIEQVISKHYFASVTKNKFKARSLASWHSECGKILEPIECRWF